MLCCNCNWPQTSFLYVHNRTYVNISIDSLQPTAATNSAEQCILKPNTTEHSFSYLVLSCINKTTTTTKKKPLSLLTLASGDEVNGRLNFVCGREGWRQLLCTKVCLKHQFRNSPLPFLSWPIRSPGLLTRGMAQAGIFPYKGKECAAAACPLAWTLQNGILTGMGPKWQKHW